MPIDLKSLKKLETLPASAQTPLRGDEQLAVILKVREGASCPDYVIERARITDEIVTADVRADDLPRLEADPNVLSVSLARKLPSLG